MIQPVILSGGSGTRLWPLSREQMPKQFLSLLGSDSLLQQTLQRLDGLSASAPMIIGSHTQRFLLAEQVREHNVTLVLEPEGRNTAPAIACAALLAQQNGEDPLLLVLPADHAIDDVAAFQQSVTNAETLAKAGYLVTFGVVPTHPETGYGYIVCDKLDGGESLTAGYRVHRFIEKPDAERAKALIAQGDTLWNSGMFLFKASAYLNELAAHEPQMMSTCEAAVASAHRDLDFLRLGKAAFEAIPAESIDVAVMERSRRAAVVPLNAGWCDIGSFDALWAASPQDAAGNVAKGDAWLCDTRRSLVMADQRLVVTLGVEDMVVVEANDAVLVAHRTRAQEVKALVASLAQARRPEAQQSAQVHRPWGSFQTMERGARYQVKHISVKPGGKLSLQRHQHRAEHWVVVSGTALVTLGDQAFWVSENQSTYIPIGAVHRLENPGKIPLVLIEVQSGAYLGEDDIERLDDVYSRHNEAP
ncbi:mannose-1-phosphate guanylyltransferase/mannose-6-phosphate isomerase [Vreelandella salicampi]|uniref:mannose-1-phosphate guanylyltransferase n=1 Tax=Vreelandella salicampi TaxID=1449798 RepID=A0A7Z0LI80_9GAMM|nr:mannose-1-phosphate guanylyltransferase/mannose-6-phosphate isomerase [Halomonas salicampi]NYS59491.1 mannose-1-phosphate guanylyltransferase/mannose-6-phosphate isomerase [Halomonas salicampi]